MNSAIEMRGITKHYSGSTVLDNVSFEVAPGSFCALVGKNGVGKSTLMRILMRYDRPSLGEGSVLGHNLKSDPEEFNADIGYVSESLDYAVPTSISAFFQHYARLHPRWDQKLFEMVLGEMTVPLARQFRDLSRGQKMQVAFAAAIAKKPKLLILDEITAVMDANARSFFMQFLGNFTSEGNTVFMATNIISEVQHFAKNVLLLNGGAVGLSCPVADIEKKFQKVRRMKGGSDPIFKDIEAAEVTLNADLSVSYVLPTEAAKKYGSLETLRDKRAITLEEIFIYLTRSRWK